MGISFFLALALVFLQAHPLSASNLTASEVEAQILPPFPPDTSTAEALLDIEKIAVEVENSLHPEAKRPTRLAIPSIRLNAPVVGVGINSQGEMDVPDGATKNVGWYRYGTIPGQIGSAVMDAHVYAAFSKLKYVKVDSHIYVTNERGETLDFVVKDSRVYSLAEVPLQLLFNRADTKRLNLITCAGKFSRKLNTYEKRLIVYAELVQ